jgi:FkbM family methyltransferase
MKGITIRNGKPIYDYQGAKIDSPIDSLEAYVEVFCENVYDRIATPKVGGTVIDIGAYVGMYSVKASKSVGDKGLVVAVEPLPSNISYLERNVANLSNVKVARTALSDYIGSARLYSSPSSAAHSITYVRKDFTVVNVTTLDELVKSLSISKVDYIKMDAEGSDINILLGAKNTLVKDSPVLSMACYHTDSDGVPYVDKVVLLLQNMGYKCITKKGYIYAHKENLK